MHPTRREMLRLGLGSSALLACGPTVPQFLARSAHALAEDRPTAKGQILVVVQLDGGNDGLNTVVPYRDDEYRKRRPKLAISAGEVKKVDDRVGLHPRLEPFAKLLEQERLAIVQGVGYPNPNRSHFDSMAIWQTAKTELDKAAPGWLARTLDRQLAPNGDAAGLHIHEAFPLPWALAGGRQVIPSMARLEQFRRRLGMPQGAEATAQIEALDRLARQARGEPGSPLQFVERCGLITYASSARLERIQQDQPTAKADYPEGYGLARRLQWIAQLIKAGLTTAIYYTHLDGFDTHSGQLPRHANLLSELGTSLRAFLNDLEKSGESERVVVLVFSEFGRRLDENGSGGTDHGTAAPVFLLGQPVKAGLHGPYPDLTHLEDGDPIHAVDFRRIYATLLDRWLGVPHRDILGADFEPLPVLRG
ncbi:Uncharacterized conserved protein, DUF1501 family [Singulisphaera sp. GP187]|uniref:DUF1501 domain-containing protein n=1 Tax=Singulisphaera sp. GP187 TaxID=1882752 RepID=UPI00092CD8F2|nr:DUF1501 domain-containing protein [Singulisphaera sp. GP187]SIN70390.1 Uncharacterized conserved protein, DUF1501 family [Singulisphaera sp. GP187]